MDRRQMFGGLGAVFGWLLWSKAPLKAAEPTGLKGIIVFKINVGCLPPYKAEAFIDRLKDKWKKSLTDKDNLKGWETIWQPFRPNGDFYENSSTQVFLIDKNGNKNEILPELVDFHADLKEEFQGKYEQFKEEVKDYILLMLGAPVVKIELDEQQIDLCITETYDDMDRHAYSIGGINALPIRGIGILKKGALARAKIILGRVRSKFQFPPGPDGHPVLDGGWLLTEGTQELAQFYDDLKEL